MYGHGKHIWAEMQRQKKKSKAPEDNRGELTRSTTSKRAAKINVTKKKLLKKAGKELRRQEMAYMLKACLIPLERGCLCFIRIMPSPPSLCIVSFAFPNDGPRALVSSAADKSKMEQGVFWTKNNAYMFEDIMNDVLPMPRPVSPGEIMVYNSPRPSVLDSDEEDEEERRLCNNLMVGPTNASTQFSPLLLLVR